MQWAGCIYHDENWWAKTDNDIEEDPKYLVDKSNLLDFLILQRQANLIVDMNYSRYCHIDEAIDDWKSCIV